MTIAAAAREAAFGSPACSIQSMLAAAATGANSDVPATGAGPGRSRSAGLSFTGASPEDAGTGPAPSTARTTNACASKPGVLVVGRDSLCRAVVGVVALHEGDDAAAEAGAGEPGADRAVLDEQLDEQIELGGRHGVVVAQAGVAREQERTERVHVVVLQCRVRSRAHAGSR